MYQRDQEITGVVKNLPGPTPTATDPESRMEILYRSHYRDLYAFCLRRVASGDDAQDVVAEVFTTAWRTMSRVPQPPEDRLWLFGVARRIIYRHHRGENRCTRLVGRLSQERPASPADTEDQMLDVVRRAISGLPLRDREALQLVMWDRLTRNEAASVLGCSRSTLDVRFHRAKKRLQALLDEPAHRLTEGNPK